MPFLLHIPNNGLEQTDGCAEFLPLLFRERSERTGKRFDAALAPLPQERYAFGCGFEADPPAVFRGVAADQSRALKALDDATHGGRANLLGIGEFAERSRSTEDEDGKRGELRRADAAFAVANTEPAKQMDGGGMKLIGEFDSRQCSACSDGRGRDTQRRGTVRQICVRQSGMR